MISSDNVEKLIDRANAVPSAEMNRKTLNDIFEAQEESKKTNSVPFKPNIRRVVLWRKAGYLAAAFLIVSSLVACLVLSGKVADLRNELEQSRRDVAVAQQNITPAQSDDTATINFYLEEHRDLVAQQASMSSTTSQPAQIRVSQQDILYYEFFDGGPEYMNPGIIVRRPSTQLQTGSTNAPTIANGHTLTLSEARKTAGFKLVSRSWLHPGYKLDEIRRIEGRDALQLLYTDGINSVSLFEQPLNGQRGLGPKDFREYAVYRNEKQAGGTILAWKDDEISYVLIGNIEMSLLMDIAQSVSAVQ
jgi:hypothetical protein